MKFFDPAKVYLEKNCVWNHREEICSFGTKAFIVTGKHSAFVNGSLIDVTKALDSGSIPYEIFNRIEENPSVETCELAAKEGIESDADFVIGIGGGSPLDAAKAIALLMANPEETAECFYNKKDLSPLPVIAVPTTCGTGSEVTGKAVLTRHEKKTKKSIAYDLFPDLSLIDGKYLIPASPQLLLNTSIDALAHLIESRLNTNSNIMNRMFSEYGLKLWKSLLPYLDQEKPMDEKAREQFMLTSTIAGMSIAQAGTSIPHAMSYDITYNYGVPHGKACGLYLAAYMNVFSGEYPEDVNEVLNILGFHSLEEFTEKITGYVGTFAISQDDLSAYISNMLSNPGKLSTCPFPLSAADVEKIMTDSLIITQ